MELLVISSSEITNSSDVADVSRPLAKDRRSVFDGAVTWLL